MFCLLPIALWNEWLLYIFSVLLHDCLECVAGHHDQHVRFYQGFALARELPGEQDSPRPVPAHRQYTAVLCLVLHPQHEAALLRLLVWHFHPPPRLCGGRDVSLVLDSHVATVWRPTPSTSIPSCSGVVGPKPSLRTWAWRPTPWATTSASSPTTCAMGRVVICRSRSCLRSSRRRSASPPRAYWECAPRTFSSRSRPPSPSPREATPATTGTFRTTSCPIWGTGLAE